LDVVFDHNDVHGTLYDGGSDLIADVHSMDNYIPYVGQIRITGNTIDCRADGGNCMILKTQDPVVMGNTILVSTGNAIGIKVEGPLSQTAIITHNNISNVGSVGILLNAPASDGSDIIDNTITGVGGAIGVYVTSPATPNAGVDAIYNNSITGFTTAVQIDLALHPGAILTAPVGLATNGTPISWLQSYGFTTNFDAAELIDSDGDGVQAWQEYIAGTDPTDAASVFRISRLDATSNPLIEWYATPNSGVTTGCRIYRCTDLMAPAWQLVASNLTRSGTGTNLWTDPNVFPQAFYRVAAPK
jgi:hypothetical protein